MAGRSKKTKIRLILGGARSGKSGYAQSLAEALWRRPLYLATAEAIDREMADRIRLHRAARDRRWICVEEPLQVAWVIANPPSTCDGILLDCLTVWLSNVLVKEGGKTVQRRQMELLAALRSAQKPVILVANEVGLGLVPVHKLGRIFRDEAGRLNQALATLADEVVFVAAGLPLALKGKMTKLYGDESNAVR